MIVDLRRQGPEASLWAREWRDRSTALHALLAAVDRESLAPASALLAWVRQCRLTLADPPDPRLRSLSHCTLDEIWEAACSFLYGDLEPARRHMNAALRCVGDMEEILQGAGIDRRGSP